MDTTPSRLSITSLINKVWINKILEDYGLPNLKNFIKKSEKIDDAKRKYLKYKIKYLELKKLYKI